MSMIKQFVVIRGNQIMYSSDDFEECKKMARLENTEFSKITILNITEDSSTLKIEVV